MTQEKEQVPVSLNPRLAACIAKESEAVDYRLLVEGAKELIHDNLAEEALEQRKLARDTVLLLGPHIRSTPKLSAWEAYKK